MGIEAMGICHAVNGGVQLGPITATFGAERVTAVLGEPGAGKTALVQILGGQLAPSMGRVWLNGRRLSLYAPTPLKCLLAFLPRETRTELDHTVQDTVAHGCFAHRYAPRADEAKIVKWAMALTHTTRLAHRVHNQLNDAERACVQLAHAMVQLWEPSASRAPRYLLMAPLVGAIDTAQQTELLRIATDWTRARRVGLVFATSQHELTTRYADDVFLLRSGELVAQGPANASTTV